MLDYSRTDIAEALTVAAAGTKPGGVSYYQNNNKLDLNFRGSSTWELQMPPHSELFQILQCHLFQLEGAKEGWDQLLP